MPEVRDTDVAAGTTPPDLQIGSKSDAGVGGSLCALGYRAVPGAACDTERKPS